eukprot:2829582-Rhodomonas_salina.2
MGWRFHLCSLRSAAIGKREANTGLGFGKLTLLLLCDGDLRSEGVHGQHKLDKVHAFLLPARPHCGGFHTCRQLRIIEKRQCGINSFD